jgi:NAD+ diphosphatase
VTLDRLYLSRSTVDRAAERRTDPELIDGLLADPDTAVLLTDGDLAPVTTGREPHLVLVDAATALAHVEKAWAEPEPTGTPGSAAGPRVERIYLGREADGREHVALIRTTPPVRRGPADPTDPVGARGVERPALRPDTRWAGLRDVGALFDDTDAGLMTIVVGMSHWHAGHRFCARCGAPSRPVQAGWARECPVCGAEHYPRTDAAVIMAVTDPADRILLGHKATWPDRRYSCLAGFVEPGESLEATVRREAHEEAGVVVDEVEYRGSQPWPFPASLMLGFRARAVGTEITVDGDELSDARWWTREELALDVATGELLLPPAVSIARRLVEEWYGGPLHDDGAGWR